MRVGQEDANCREIKTLVSFIMTEKSKTTQSEALFERAQRAISSGANSPILAFKNVSRVPFYTQSVDGSVLRTQDGRELIDFVGTWEPAVHEHKNPRIREAITRSLL